ncbi:MAG: hypothetical protein MJE68_02190, partial [Proteobacteria bacterium]|nr:hypothetical protein [Pseudomonadota bacterium]
METMPYLLKTIVKLGDKPSFNPPDGGGEATNGGLPQERLANLTPAPAPSVSTTPAITPPPPATPTPSVPSGESVAPPSASSPEVRHFIRALQSMPLDQAEDFVAKAKQALDQNAPNSQSADALSAMMLNSVQTIVTSEVEVWMKKHLAEVVTSSLAAMRT